MTHSPAVEPIIALIRGLVDHVKVATKKNGTDAICVNVVKFIQKGTFEIVINRPVYRSQ
jgi:hypothetical protein